MKTDQFDIRQSRKTSEQILVDLHMAKLAYPALQPAKNPRITVIHGAMAFVAAVFAWIITKLLNQ